MGKTYIFTLGFHEDFIIRRLHQTAASKDDTILIFTASPAVASVKKAYQNLVAYTATMNLSEPILVELKLDDFYGMVSQILEWINQAQQPIIADLSGGMRMIGITVYTSLLIHGHRAKIYIADETGEAREISTETSQIRTLLQGLSEEKLNIVKLAVQNPGITTAEAARQLGKSEKTIQNHLAELKKNAILTQKGKARSIYPTKIAEVIVKIHSPK